MMDAGPVTGAIGNQPETRQPRIVYVINSFDRGGAEAGLVALVKGGLFENCRLRILALVRGRGGLEKQLCDLGHEPQFLLDRPRMRTADLLRIVVRLQRTLARECPDIVIASLPQANLLVRLCLAFQRRTLLVSFEHNTHLAKRVYEVGYRLTSGRVDWTFADADSTLAKASERLYQRIPARRTVVPLVSFDSPANSHYAPRADEPFQLVNAARFTTTKNQAALVEAVSILVNSGHNVSCTLYGDGPERDACEALAARLNVSDRVRFAGFVPDWARHPADLFVLPSRHEGLCLVVLEAMHGGIPVMAPIIGGLCDYAAPGLLHAVPDVEPRTLAQAIVRVIEQRERLPAQVARAAEMVDRLFNAATVRRLYVEINEALIEEATAQSMLREPAARRGAASLG
jgi:glycosyltransferase involved in cell wall biosynthesis